MHKRVIFLIGACVVLSGCGMGQRNNVADYLEPIQIEASLEKRFDEEAGLVSTIISDWDYPETIPTHNISFTADHRFAISFELEIEVDNLERDLTRVWAMDWMKGQRPYLNVEIHEGDKVAEFSVRAEDAMLDNIFHDLYAVGQVTGYVVTVFDMDKMPREDDEVAWAERWAQHNQIDITIREINERG